MIIMSCAKYTHVVSRGRWPDVGPCPPHLPAMHTILHMEVVSTLSVWQLLFCGKVIAGPSESIWPFRLISVHKCLGIPFCGAAGRIS